MPAVPSSCLIDNFSQSFATKASAKVDDTATAVNHNRNTPIDQNRNIVNAKPKTPPSNANPSEVNKFSSFASHWWDSRANPLVGMNPIRVKFMREAVHEFQPATKSTNDSFHLPLHNKRFLDIGCGGGLLTESFSRLGASLVVGVDASSAVVDVAKTHSFRNPEQTGNLPTNTEQGNIRYIGGLTVEELASRWLSEREEEQKLPSTDQSHNHELFDVITALEVIEHVPNPTSLLHAAKTLLKPNGILFVSTINRTVKSYGMAIVAAEYITGKVPVGTHDWNQFWSPAEVEQMVCKDSSIASSHTSRMERIALSGMVIQPPFVNLQWSLDASDVDVNWIGAYQKQVSP